MKRKIVSILILVLLLCIGFEILTNSLDVMNAVNLSFRTWLNNVFPALFPFFVLSELLIQYGFVEFLGELLRKVMNKCFHLKGECAFVLAMSMVSGFPSGAKYTKSLYKEGIIDEQDATKLLTFTHFSNPLFIMGTVATTFLKDKKLGICILICHFLSNFFVGLCFRQKRKTYEKEEKISLRRAVDRMHKKRINNQQSFGQIVSTAIKNTLQTLLMMLGIITFFFVLTTIIKQNIKIDSYHQALLSGLMEMTQGIQAINSQNLPLLTKSIWTIFFLSFGGFSVHMQVISIICDTKIKYYPFFIARLLHASFASLLLFLIMLFL